MGYKTLRKKEGSKIKTYLVELGGESIVTKDEDIHHVLNQLTGKELFYELEPEQGEEDLEIKITIQRKYTIEEFKKLPEYQ